jgi:hypothetical protein
VTTMMKARSSLGRNFIEICKCAGWGDVGYINRWYYFMFDYGEKHKNRLINSLIREKVSKNAGVCLTNSFLSFFFSGRWRLQTIHVIIPFP